MPEDISPAPQAAAEEKFPVCPHCGKDLEHVRYLDYANVRVVYHDDGCNKTIGTIAVL